MLLRRLTTTARLHTRPLSSVATSSPAPARLNPLQAYRHLSRTAPLATAFATCFAKGAASDAVSQLQVEKAEKMDWKRNAVFATFSAAYLGIGQHLVYNVAFARIFGTRTDMWTGLKKVIADSTVHVPMIYLPLYYPFKAVALGEGSVRDGLERYAHDAKDVLTTYWSAWPAVHFISFTVCPVELRISFVASVSFVWLVYLSYASHREDPSRVGD